MLPPGPRRQLRAGLLGHRGWSPACRPRRARGSPLGTRERQRQDPPPYLAAGGCLQRRPRRTATCSAPPCARGTARRKESYQQRGTSPSERGRRLPARRGACARPRHAARRSAGSGRCSVPRSSPAASDSGGEGPGHRSASRGRTAPPPQQRPQLHGWGGTQAAGETEPGGQTQSARAPRPPAPGAESARGRGSPAPTPGKSGARGGASLAGV